MKALISEQVKNNKGWGRENYKKIFARNTEEIINIIEEGKNFDIIIVCEKNPEVLKKLLKLILESTNETELRLSDEHVVPFTSVAILP